MPRIYLTPRQRSYLQSLTGTIPARPGLRRGAFWQRLCGWGKRWALLLASLLLLLAASRALAAPTLAGPAAESAATQKGDGGAATEVRMAVDARFNQLMGYVLLMLAGCAVVVLSLYRAAPVLVERYKQPVNEWWLRLRDGILRRQTSDGLGTALQDYQTGRSFVAELPAPATLSPPQAVLPLSHVPPNQTPVQGSRAGRNLRVVGAVSRRGHVRYENQDRSNFLSLSDYTHAVMVSDGMGGLPYGALAAAVAARKAAHRIIETYSVRVEGLDVATIAYQAVAAAQRAIEMECDKAPHLRRGFRTTLIVALIDGTKLGWAHIGDGGGAILRPNSMGGFTLQHFVRPMKEFPGDNRIAASLGPRIDGVPSYGRMDVRPGDIVLIGSDGVLDFDWENREFRGVCGEDLARAIYEAIDEFGGDVCKALAVIVDDLVSQKDPQGFYVVDDNTSLAAICVPPRNDEFNHAA